MKLFYLANIRLPTEKAHGIQIMKMCEAFADAGAEVELVVPRRHNHITDNPFTYYHARRLFGVSRVFSVEVTSFGRIGFLFQSLSFSLAVLWRFFKIKKQKDTIFYSRDEMPAYLLSFFGKKVVWEAHMGHDNFFIRSLIRRDVPIVCISGGLSELYCSFGAKNILVSPDGVDIKQFQTKDTKDEARIKLGLPREAKLVMYTGHLYSWKGADVLAEATPKLSDDVCVIFVGGTKKDVEVFKNKYGEIKNIMILGSKPHSEIPMYMRAADVLVLPNSAKEKISRLYTSPMKLFEYMASGTPIVASDLPSIREVLNERNSVLVFPDSPEDIARGLAAVLSDIKKASTLAEQALRDIEQYSWTKRAKSIIDFIFSRWHTQGGCL